MSSFYQVKSITMVHSLLCNGLCSTECTFPICVLDYDTGSIPARYIKNKNVLVSYHEDNMVLWVLRWCY